LRRYVVGLLCCLCMLSGTPAGEEAHLVLRSRVEAFKGSGDRKPVAIDFNLPVSKTALILCDMWDRHWCDTASQRVDALAKKISPVVDMAREKGVLIIHAPSDTMDFYKTQPERLKILQFPQVQPPEPVAVAEPPLPIDDSDGGCDNPNNSLKRDTKVWTREHSAIHIGGNDLVSDNGREVYNALRARGIQTLLIAGVHTNMCVLNRSFAIRQMTQWGIRCILIRDLTDAMYNPARRPFVSHQRGTEMVIEHIESYWVPTVTSDQLARALQQTASVDGSKTGPLR
jgi:nicotinamidase-related amidase